MSEKPKVKVQIEWGDVKHTVEGDLESVIREVMQFAAKVLPNYTLASKLTFSPDYSSMVDDLSESVKLTPEGEAVFLKPELSAENSIALVLLAVRVANAVGTRPTVDMSPDAISRAIGKSVKTVRNTLALLTKTGVVDRTSEGNYKLTIQGIRKSHEIAKGLIARSATSASSRAQTEVTASG
jgi:DNA-binding transcriptional ArsR family regulator